MKKIFFYISLVLFIVLIINVIVIFSLGMDNLSEYGLGYLMGKIILLIAFATILFFTRKSVFK